MGTVQWTHVQFCFRFATALFQEKPLDLPQGKVWACNGVYARDEHAEMEMVSGNAAYV
jgi:hypothetical protein